MGQSLSNKYGPKLLNSAKKSTTDAIQKIAEATGDLIGNRITDKITSVSKKPAKSLPNDDETDAEVTTHRKRYISPEERQEILEELRLIPKKDVYF